LQNSATDGRSNPFNREIPMKHRSIDPSRAPRDCDSPPRKSPIIPCGRSTMTTKSTSVGIAAALAVMIGISASAAAADRGAATEDDHVHPPAAGEKLGAVHFPVSCNPEARERFSRAVAILHSF